MSSNAGESLSKRIADASSVDALLKVVNDMKPQVYWTGRRFTLEGWESSDHVRMKDIWIRAKQLENTDEKATHENISALHSAIKEKDDAGTKLFKESTNILTRCWLAIKRVFVGFNREELEAYVFADNLLKSWKLGNKFDATIREAAAKYKTEHGGKFLPHSYIYAVIKSVPLYEYWCQGSQLNIDAFGNANVLARAFMGYYDTQEVSREHQEIIRELQTLILASGHLNHDIATVLEKNDFDRMDLKQLQILKQFCGAYSQNEIGEPTQNMRAVDLSERCDRIITGRGDFLTGLINSIKRQNGKIVAEDLAKDESGPGSAGLLCSGRGRRPACSRSARRRPPRRTHPSRRACRWSRPIA